MWLCYREVATETCSEWQQEVAERAARERAQRAIEMHAAADTVASDLVDEVTTAMCLDASRACIRLAAIALLSIIWQLS